MLGRKRLAKNGQACRTTLSHSSSARAPIIIVTIYCGWLNRDVSFRSMHGRIVAPIHNPFSVSSSALLPTGLGTPAPVAHATVHGEASRLVSEAPQPLLYSYIVFTVVFLEQPCCACVHSMLACNAACVGAYMHTPQPIDSIGPLGPATVSSSQQWMSSLLHTGRRVPWPFVCVCLSLLHTGRREPWPFVCDCLCLHQLYMWATSGQVFFAFYMIYIITDSLHVWRRMPKCFSRLFV